MIEPRTVAGRKHLQWLLAGDDVFEEDALRAVLDIEDEATDRTPSAERTTEAFDRLQESIEGERRFWREVTVRPDDVAMAVEYIAGTVPLLPIREAQRIVPIPEPSLNVERLARAHMLARGATTYDPDTPEFWASVVRQYTRLSEEAES